MFPIVRCEEAITQLKAHQSELNRVGVVVQLFSVPLRGYAGPPDVNLLAEFDDSRLLSLFH